MLQTALVRFAHGIAVEGLRRQLPRAPGIVHPVPDVYDERVMLVMLECEHDTDSGVSRAALDD